MQFLNTVPCTILRNIPVNSAAAGSDVILVHKNDNGTGYTITDAHAIGFFQPVPDASQDVVLLQFRAQGNQMSATFTRRFKTCDADGDHEIQRGLGQFMIWAHGKAFGPGFSGISYHGTVNRGYVQRQMLDLLPKKGKGQPAATAAASADSADSKQEPPQPLISVSSQKDSVSRLTSQLQHFYNGGVQAHEAQQLAVASAAANMHAAADLLPLPDIRDNGDGTFEADILCKVPDIPAVQTTYMNCYVRLPDDKKYHITSYTTIRGNQELVHHSVVYACLRENAEPQVIDLVAKSGPGPYNQVDQRMLCEVFYMVSTYGHIGFPRLGPCTSCAYLLCGLQTDSTRCACCPGSTVIVVRISACIPCRQC